jgi:hypothetical protein
MLAALIWWGAAVVPIVAPFHFDFSKRVTGAWGLPIRKIERCRIALMNGMPHFQH